MRSFQKYAVSLVAFAGLMAAPCVAQDASKTAAEKREATKQDSFDKAGKATEKGMSAAGKGTGAAVEHTGRSAVIGAKSAAKGASTAASATGKAMKSTAGAVTRVFGRDGRDHEHDLTTPDSIRSAQQALQSQGYYGGSIDGIIGPITRSGLREFQTDEKLKVTGELDFDTAKKLGVI